MKDISYIKWQAMVSIATAIPEWHACFCTRPCLGVSAVREARPLFCVSSWPSDVSVYVCESLLNNHCHPRLYSSSGDVCVYVYIRRCVCVRVCSCAFVGCVEVTILLSYKYCYIFVVVYMYSISNIAYYNNLIVEMSLY